MASYKQIKRAVEAERARTDARLRQQEAERLAVPSFDYLADTVDGFTDAAASLGRRHPRLRRTPREEQAPDATR